MKEFCLLRSQSVEGQLNGTIGTTTEEQKETQNELIDSSSLELSNLGSMGNGMGGFGGRDNFGKNTETDKTQNKDEESNELEGKEEVIPVDAKVPTNGVDRNNFNISGDSWQNFDFGNMNNRENPRNMGQMQQGTDTKVSGNVILTIVSFVILIGGIVFVKKFKR